MSDTGSASGRGRRRAAAPTQPPQEAADGYEFVDDEDSPDVLGWMAFAESRTDRREERRRRFRFRLVAVGVVIAVAAAAVGGWLLYRALNGPPPPDARDSILFQVSDATGDAIGSALLVDDPARKTAVALVVPNGLDVDVAGQNILTFSQALGQLGPGGCQDALSNLVGSTIGGTWTLNPVSFAGLVDQAGGVQVPVDAAFPGMTGTVRAGTQILDGADATLYAALARPGEDSSVQTGRFTQVLDSLLARLVSNKANMTAILGRIGMVPTQQLPQDRLADTLARVVGATQSGHLTTAALPVTPIADAAPHESLNVGAAAPLVQHLLGGTVRTVRSNGPPRVMVQDGTAGAPAPGGPSGSKPSGTTTRPTGSSTRAATPHATTTAAPTAGADASTAPQAAETSWPTLAEEAQVALTGAGFVSVNGGALPDGAKAQHTQILISDPTKRSTADQVAQVLGFDDSVVKVVSTPQLTDVVVVVGEDYNGSQ